MILTVLLVIMASCTFYGLGIMTCIHFTDQSSLIKGDINE